MTPSDPDAQTAPHTHPLTWLVLSDKKGDNGQVDTIAQALPWPCERRYLQMLEPFVFGKPPVEPTLDHIDKQASDPLEPPWPDLILTVGRRCANVALWIREQSGGRTRILLVGKPSGMTETFDLIVHSSEAQLPPLPNVMGVGLPLMQVSQASVAVEAEVWRPRLADLPRPLIAILIGGPTGPFVFDERVERRLLELAREVIEDHGGTPYIVTSRRTPAPLIERLNNQLPDAARLFPWTPEAMDNPYRALLGLADGFIVTGDSVSMMVEVVRLRKPLAILGLPTSLLGTLDQARRAFTRWMFSPVDKNRSLGQLRQRLGVALFRLGVLGHTRDFRAFHQSLIRQGLAVRAGTPFRDSHQPLPDDLPRIVERIGSLLK